MQELPSPCTIHKSAYPKFQDVEEEEELEEEVHELLEVIAVVLEEDRATWYVCISNRAEHRLQSGH